MMQRAVKVRAAAGQQYAIIVGLIGVIALFAITQMGQGVNSLLSRTGNTLTGVVNETGGSAPSGGGPSGDCNVTRANCAAHYAAGCTSSAIYSVQPGSTIVSAWCEMAIDGGGWTQAMTVNVNDGNKAFFSSPLWTGSSFGSDINRWNDYKNAIANELNANSVLIVVRQSVAAGGAGLKGWRSWNFNTPRSLQSIFDLPIGAYNLNATGGCNAGSSGAGNLVTAGIKSSGQCASFTHTTAGLAEDTFTCYAANLYSNSDYGNCSASSDSFRLSSWYRWANNSNVGLGLRMDGGGVYDSEAGTHMAIDSINNPQRYCTNAPSCTNTYSSTLTNITPGGDRNSSQNTIGENWRYEFYVK